jgi:hypothetical protein
MTRACGADDIKNILYPALFRKLRFQMIDDTLLHAHRECHASLAKTVSINKGCNYFKVDLHFPVDEQ